MNRDDASTTASIVGAFSVLELCAAVFTFTSGSSALLGRPRCGLSICHYVPYSIHFWVYANFFHEKNGQNAKKYSKCAIFVCCKNGRRRLPGAQSINTGRAYLKACVNQTIGTGAKGSSGMGYWTGTRVSWQGPVWQGCVTHARRTCDKHCHANPELNLWVDVITSFRAGVCVTWTSFTEQTNESRCKVKQKQNIKNVEDNNSHFSKQ